MQLVSRYNVFCTTMGWTLFKGLVMAKRWATLKTRAIWGGMRPCVIWEQSWNNWGNPFVESSGWKHYNKRCSCMPSDFIRFRVNSLVLVNED